MFVDVKLNTLFKGGILIFLSIMQLRRMFFNLEIQKRETVYIKKFSLSRWTIKTVQSEAGRFLRVRLFKNVIKTGVAL